MNSRFSALSLPHTSIVTCTFNSLNYLKKAIHSVLFQTTQHFEYLILDDGSNDETWEYLKSYKLPSHFRIFRNPKNLGLTASRNRLLNESRGKFISILDADDCLYPKKTELHAQILLNNPEVGVVLGKSRVHDLKKRKYFTTPDDGYTHGWDLTTPYSFTHSATTWRKSALIKVKGYSPDWTLVEAVDMYFKVGDIYRQVYDPTLVAFKRILDNPFRRTLRRTGKKLSHKLILATLKRRYPNLSPSTVSHDNKK